MYRHLNQINRQYANDNSIGLKIKIIQDYRAKKIKIKTTEMNTKMVLHTLKYQSKDPTVIRNE